MERIWVSLILDLLASGETRIGHNAQPWRASTGKVSGAWVFKNTRLPVATVIENLEDSSVEEVIEQFDVTQEQITAVLEFVAQSLKASAPAQTTAPADAHSL